MLLPRETKYTQLSRDQVPAPSPSLLIGSVLGALSSKHFASTRTVCLLSVRVLKQRAKTSPEDGFPLLPLHFDFEQGWSRWQPETQEGIAFQTVNANTQHLRSCDRRIYIYFCSHPFQCLKHLLWINVFAIYLWWLARGYKTVNLFPARARIFCFNTKLPLGSFRFPSKLFSNPLVKQRNSVLALHLYYVG
jgi:hypothetical protein